MTLNARRFRVEGGASRPVLRFPDMALPAGGAIALPVEAGMGQSLLDEIRALRATIDPLRGIMDSMSDTYRNDLKVASSIRADMSEIDQAISGTKRELAAIKVGNTIGGVDVAALELTTVVTQTEAATNDILAASEAIETMAGAIQSETTLEAAKALAQDIAERITIIYMACNFQDLSGQRVTRVVDTLNFIEGRIHRMIEAWGGLQALHDLIETEIKTKEEERATEGAASLLTGPVPVNSTDHVGQNEIDALFN